jgi:hypothetical protein
MSQFSILVTDRLPAFSFGLCSFRASHKRWPEANRTGGAVNSAVNPSTSFSEHNPTSESRVL